VHRRDGPHGLAENLGVQPARHSRGSDRAMEADDRRRVAVAYGRASGNGSRRSCPCPQPHAVADPRTDRSVIDRAANLEQEIGASERCRAGRAAWHRDHRGDGQFPGEPSGGEIAVDALVTTRLRSPAPGTLRRLQRHARLRLRTENSSSQPSTPASSARGLTTPNVETIPKSMWHRQPWRRQPG